MTERDCICQPTDHKERNEHSASCNRAFRTKQSNELKPAKAKKPIAKVGKKNTFECSDGTRITQSDINSLKDKMYGFYDAIQTDSYCEGCGSEPAQGHAHIIPQSRCKNLNKTELIWEIPNIFKACHKCNAIAENVSSPAIMQLKNYPRIKSFLELHDYERFTKLPDYSIANEPHKI